MLDERDTSWCLQAATALARCSSHPLSKAFTGATSLQAKDVRSVVGSGVEARVDDHLVRFGSAAFCGFPCSFTGDTTIEEEDSSVYKSVYLSVDAAPAAVFEVALLLREDAPALVQALKRSGVDVSMLSGDVDSHCRRVAQALSIPYSATVSPEAKAEAVTNARTLYVGDGVNDLPAIAASALSATTLETSDLVKSRADIVVMSQRLTSLLDLLQVSGRFKRVLLQNIAWAGAYNVVCIPLAALGYFPPWVAALGMSASSLLVIANAARLLRVPLPSRALRS